MHALKRLFLASAFSLIALAPLLALSAPNEDGEEIPAGEADAIHQVADMIRTGVQAAADKEGHAYRDAHRKAHGCVQATFTVQDNLPATLKQGLFSAPGEYKAVIRYSNGSGEAKDDHDGDGRGMAVKVLGVQGARNLSESDDEASSQDFLMINYPVFFVRTAEDYVGFQKAASKGTGSLLLWLLNPTRVFHEGLIAKRIQGQKMVNPLDARYWSMTASKLGNTQMKFSAKPCAGSTFKSPSDGKDRLRDNLAATLAGDDACFEFQVQTRNFATAVQPIEDPTIEWTEAQSPFTTVAKIVIPSQTPDAGESCEALSFNPWNGLASMRPLGGISRARKEVYQTISRLRHDINKQRREEPRP